MEGEFPDPLGWIKVGLQKARHGELSIDDLSIPTLPGLLNLAGFSEIKGPLRITWRCCGIYEVKVSGGGLIAERPSEPTKVIASSFDHYRAGLGSESILTPGPPFNPLSWEPITFQPRETPGRCVELRGEVLCLPIALPWSPSRGDVELLRPSLIGRGPLVLGLLRSQEEGDLYSLGYGLRAWSGSDATAILTPDAATIVLTDELKLRTGLYDMDSSILYPLMFIRVRLRPGDKVEANAITLRGPRATSIISPRPLEVEVQEGRLRLRSDGSVFLVNGGEVLAFRALIE
ncbi:MAG: hypothetical protein ACP5HK_06575, partial [Acidilobus sp.]